MMKPAQPKASIGDMVSYVDHHNRQQFGLVKFIEAKWNDYGRREPFITYCVEHPTYHRRRMYVSDVFVLEKGGAA